MVDLRSTILDLTRDVDAVTRVAASPDRIDEVIAGALDALGHVVPYDLATVMELSRDELTVRVSRGRLDEPAVRTHRLRLDDFPSIRSVLDAGHARAFTEHDHVSGDGDPFHGVVDLPDGHFCMLAPLRAHEHNFGILTLDRAECGSYPQEVVNLMDVFGQLLAFAIVFGEQSARLERVRIQLAEQNRVLAENHRGPLDATALIDACRSPAMAHAAELARRVAATDAPVLITGETGTGKEVLAHAIHAWSSRFERPFVAVNCAALPAQLIESELFGHVKGAFTGATSTRLGRFQAANGGVLFLDEVGELSLELQSKLLRVLEDGCFEPVGSDRTVRVDVRIIAATNRALADRVAAGLFREDLYYRLAVFPIQLPPLRARIDDIPIIANNVLAALGRRTGRGPWRLEPHHIAALQSRPWPGNVRELVNELERATILAAGGELVIGASTAPPPPPARARGNADRSGPFHTLAEMERRHIEAALRRAGGRINGDGGAAELLGIHPSTLRSRMAKLGVERSIDISR